MTENQHAEFFLFPSSLFLLEKSIVSRHAFETISQPQETAAPKTTVVNLPPLEAGDHLSRCEFEQGLGTLEHVAFIERLQKK